MNTTDQIMGFCDAIKAASDGERAGHRRVYADWLEDHGHPEEAQKQRELAELLEEYNDANE